MDRITVVNIASVSYSGSTWINLMLGSHPRSFSVGEIKSILYTGKATCTVHGDDCDVWPRFEHPSERNAFAQIAQITGKSVLIVNNSRKYLPQQTAAHGVDAKFVHLVRDGRAVAASFLRKKPDWSMRRAARLIAHDIRRNERLIRRQPPDATAVLRYEDVQQDPEREMRRMCAFIGVDYDPAMLQFWNVPHHFLGGNRGTLFQLMSKRQGVDESAKTDRVVASHPGDWDLEHYRKTDPSKFADERWRSELNERQLRTFAFWAGRVNRRLGYPAGVER